MHRVRGPWNAKERVCSACDGWCGALALGGQVSRSKKFVRTAAARKHQCSQKSTEHEDGNRLCECGVAVPTCLTANLPMFDPGAALAKKTAHLRDCCGRSRSLGKLLTARLEPVVGEGDEWKSPPSMSVDGRWQRPTTDRRRPRWRPDAAAGGPVLR
ncbi:hypothetical protein OH77DRAFT_931689 [Trametes cingulata]|nr:hypothetical protein OH77DRAFT_931689 [Trametes cingulata]